MTYVCEHPFEPGADDAAWCVEHPYRARTVAHLSEKNWRMAQLWLKFTEKGQPGSWPARPADPV